MKILGENTQNAGITASTTYTIYTFDRFRDIVKITLHHSLHEKPYFPFPNVLEKWSFQKHRTGI